MDEVLRCHTREHVERVLAIDEHGLARRRHDRQRDDTDRRVARGRNCDRGRAHRRLRARPSARTSRAQHSGDGLLCLQQRRDRGAGARRPDGATASRSSTTTCITATERRRSSGRTTRSCSCRCTSGRSTRAAAAPTSRRETTVNIPLERRLRRRGVPARVRPRSSRRRSNASRPIWCSCRRASTPTKRTRSRRCASPRKASASSAGAAPALAPRFAAVLEGGYNVATLPGLVEAALEGFSSGNTTTG